MWDELVYMQVLRFVVAGPVDGRLILMALLTEFLKQWHFMLTHYAFGSVRGWWRTMDSNTSQCSSKS